MQSLYFSITAKQMTMKGVKCQNSLSDILLCDILLSICLRWLGPDLSHYVALVKQKPILLLRKTDGTVEAA